MGRYKVVLKPTIEKDLRNVPTATVWRIFAAIEKLEGEPLPAGVTKLEGAQKTFRIRVGDYRVVYEFSAGLREVDVLYIRHRKDVYRKR